MIDAEIVAAQVSKLSLAPDDIVIVRLPQQTMDGHVREIAEKVRQALPHVANRVLFMSDAMTIEKMTKAEREALLA